MLAALTACAAFTGGSRPGAPDSVRTFGGLNASFSRVNTTHHDETVILVIPFKEPIQEFNDAARQIFSDTMCIRLNLTRGSVSLVVGDDTITVLIAASAGGSAEVARRLSTPMRNNKPVDASEILPRSALLMPEHEANATGHRTLVSAPGRPIVPWSMKPLRERRMEATDLKKFCFQCKCQVCPSYKQPPPKGAPEEKCPGQNCLGKCNALYGCAKCTSGNTVDTPPQMVWINGYFVPKKNYLLISYPQLAELWTHPWLFQLSTIPAGLDVQGQVNFVNDAENKCSLAKRFKEGCDTGDLMGGMVETAAANIAALGIALAVGEGKQKKLGLLGGPPQCAKEYNIASWEVTGKMLAAAQGVADGLNEMEIKALEVADMALAAVAGLSYTITIVLVSLDVDVISIIINAIVAALGAATVIATPLATGDSGVEEGYGDGDGGRRRLKSIRDPVIDR